MPYDFPAKFPASIPTPLALPDEVLAAIANSEVGDSADSPWDAINQLREAHNKLQGALSYLLLTHNLPTIINGWSVALVDNLIQEHKFDRASFEVDRIVQYLNQAMWDLFTRNSDFITGSLGIRSPKTPEWLCYKKNAAAQHAMWALTERALMVNGGVKIPNGTYAYLQKVEYRYDDEARGLLFAWIHTLGDINLLPAPKVKQEAKVIAVAVSDADVW